MLQFIGAALCVLVVVYAFLTVWSLRKNIVCHSLDHGILENPADNDVSGSGQSLWHPLRRRPNLLFLSTMVYRIAFHPRIPRDATQEVDIPMAGPFEVSNKKRLLLI